MKGKIRKNAMKRRKTSVETFKKSELQIKRLHESAINKSSSKMLNKTVFDKHNRIEILGENSSEKDEEELALEQLVFGGESDVIEKLKEEEHQKEKAKKKKKAKLSNSEGQLEDENTFDNENDTDEDVRKPAWEDEDDNELLVQDKVKTLKWCHRSVEHRGSEKYKDYAKEKFLKISGTPKWAELGRKDNSSDSQEESEEELLQKTTNFLQESTSLPQGTIKIQKCLRLNDEERENTVIKSVEFHPKARVALVAGLSGTTTLFQVDGKTNAKIQSVHFERFPIHTAHFSVDGNQIVVGSKEYGHFYYYDMIAGKIIKVPWDRGMDQMNVRRFQMCPDGKLIAIHGRYGNIHLATAHTKEWIGTLKMNGEVLGIAFNRDGSRMFSHGDTGQVYIWDMSSRQCIHRFTDEGCIAGTSLALSPNEQYLATGSDSGVVNIYDTAELFSTIDPKPVKTLKNLVTEITSLKFNSTSEILGMASLHKENALKLVHFPSMTVFSNFPIQYKTIRHPNCLDMSLNSGFLAVGNNVGITHLFRLRHYGNY